MLIGIFIKYFFRKIYEGIKNKKLVVETITTNNSICILLVNQKKDFDKKLSTKFYCREVKEIAMTISIVMATYNGEKYISQQMESILPFLEKDDEIVISDDGSTDSTLEIINRYMEKSDKVKLIHGPGKGVVKNFENALQNSKKEILLFADQDDIWLPKKIPIMRKIFEKNENIGIVLHDMYEASDREILENMYKTNRSFLKRKRKHGVLYNLIYSGYVGCCMGISEEVKNYILPFSKYTNMHDQWIGLIGEYYRISEFVNQPLIIHRLHGSNVTRRQTMLKRIVIRIQSLIAFIDIISARKLRRK